MHVSLSDLLMHVLVSLQHMYRNVRASARGCVCMFVCIVGIVVLLSKLGHGCIYARMTAPPLLNEHPFGRSSYLDLTSPLH